MYSEDNNDVSFAFPRAVTVSELNDFVKRIFDLTPQFSDIYVHGEISNFKDHYSTGHFYFTLKDESSSVRAVMFNTYASRIKFKPENGMKVTVHGRVSVYPRDGQYQIYCDSMEPLGIGALYAAYEQLKKKLSEKGLFDSSHKKALPAYPSRVGVITSATGAAVRDIINVAGRRWPVAEITVFPALVQGDGAVPSLIAGLKYFNTTNSADVIIIGRGGGSLEDLWAFNSEQLAYEIYSSEIPVISAVGHETDFTIADFVSDVRAPTPSAAAEIAVPDRAELIKKLQHYAARQKTCIESLISENAGELKGLSRSRFLTDPLAFVEDRTVQLGQLSDRLSRETASIIENNRTKTAALSGMLNSLSPLSVLSRGYSTVRDRGGKILKSVSGIRAGDEVTVSMSDGSFNANIISVDGGK